MLLEVEGFILAWIKNTAGWWFVGTMVFA